MCDQLATRGAGAEVFLPLLKSRAPRWGRMATSVGPLFPGYLFAKFDLQLEYFDIRYMSGVRGIVSAGTDPLAVPAAIVNEIRRRGVNDVIEIPDKPFGKGERVLVVGGPVPRLRGYLPRLPLRPRAGRDPAERRRVGRPPRRPVRIGAGQRSMKVPNKPLPDRERPMLSLSRLRSAGEGPHSKFRTRFRRCAESLLQRRNSETRACVGVYSRASN